ncbi:uncharacterized protein LOC131695289 [Topomyia yanbarensis]|uniref:uncharacterized protein LOC131695289 n=1 Tax=Topomyia yanbarensis TaxID=2498891 RepID=UPI00273B0574|nr:uncharacterized protein LOC131695289 [Topomyia yanbarensis]
MYIVVKRYFYNHLHSGLKKIEPIKKKLKKSIQRYSTDWEKKLIWVTESPKGNLYAYCTVCEQSVKSTGGLTDLERHGGTTKHISNSKNSKIISSTHAMTSFLSQEDGSTEAELRLCAWGVQHNVPMSTIESFAKVAKDIFKDSKTAQKVKLGRTKITAIQTNVFGKCQTEELIELMKVNKWSLLVDESTDLTGKKSLAMVIRTYKWDGVLVLRDYFYKIATVTETTATALHKLIISKFDEDDVPYKNNLIGLGTDGANVMMGQHHSVGSLFRQDCPDIFLMKCICHSFALCSSYACKNIPSEVEQLCRDVYNFLKYGGQRQARFNDLQCLLELQPLKMLHPSATRWLSLEAVVLRMVNRYDVLLIYFNFIDDRADKSTREKQAAIRKVLVNPLTKTYLLFLSYILPAINKLNRLFQSETPELCRLHTEVSQLYRSILDNFLNADYMLSCKDPGKVIFEQRNYKELDALYIGTAAKSHLEGIKSNNLIQRNDVTQFLTNIMNYYISLANQIQIRIHFEEPVLVNMIIIDPKNVIERVHESILPLINAFPNLVTSETIQEMDSEFREVRNVDFRKYTEEERRSSSAFWSKVLSVQRTNGEFSFPHLRKFIAELLILPHSSASVERLFSQYNLNKTKMRNRLSSDAMQGILATKDYVKTHMDVHGKLVLTGFVKKNFNSHMYNVKCK